jgi:hypothetical protein
MIVAENGDLHGGHKVEVNPIRQGDAIHTKIGLTLKDKERTLHLEMNSLLPTDTAEVILVPFGDKEFLLSIKAREYVPAIATEDSVATKQDEQSSRLPVRLGQRIGNRR